MLYGFGILEFGVFHMKDYLLFRGIAAYLALTSLGTLGSLGLLAPILSGALAFSQMWTAIEKFVYLAWTLAVVAAHANVGSGFPASLVTVGAGFVEFMLAFYAMTGCGLVRLGAGFYALIFISAIPEFGHLDAVGHIPIVGILAVVCGRGASPLQRWLGLLERGIFANAAAHVALFFVSLIGLFGMYYGLHWAEYG